MTCKPLMRVICYSIKMPLCWMIILMLYPAGYVIAAGLPFTEGYTTENNDISAGGKHVTESAENANQCPQMVPYIFDNAMPNAEWKAGIYEKYSVVEENAVDGQLANNLRSCIAGCCEKRRNNTCNVVVAFKLNCYHVRCASNEACLPKQRPIRDQRLQMVLINPVRHLDNKGVYLSWWDTLKNLKLTEEIMDPDSTSEAKERLNFWKHSRKAHLLSRNFPDSAISYYDEEPTVSAEKKLKLFLMNDINNILPLDLEFYKTNASPATWSSYFACDLDNTASDASRCPVNEKCVELRTDEGGVCTCIAGYVRNHQHICVADSVDGESPAAHDMYIASASTNDDFVVQQHSNIKSSTANSVDAPKKLVVSVVSKEVRLPEKEVTLAAFTVPDEQSSNTKYKYLWSLVHQPRNSLNGTISDQSQSKVKLSNLAEGLYTFKVSVTGSNGTYGEAMANVTVLPEKRINRAPQVVITPKEQTIRQPTTNAVLDGSSSTDDDKIVFWHWEVVSGPIGYQPKLPDVNTLQLTDLTSPGNYTFKLTVTDTDNLTNATTANITVLKITDYPPVANAGDAVIIYLPNNNVTLNGTSSTDDHEIVAWEWTKNASDDKAVDMQNTRTPYVKLSNLEEGMYTFVLKVTDASNQTSTAKVHVFVKPPTNSPPRAILKGNMTINLPINWVILNGSLSTDDIGIKSYHWQQILGPNTAVILKSNQKIANATGLTLGLYEFQLNVMDASNNSDRAVVWLKVVQEKNAAPVANAGGDQSVVMPITSIYLNGSNSSDDLRIVKYQWSREDVGLAAGEIVANTDREAVLILTNVVSGRYVFKLTVSDEQGLSNSDTVSVFVHPDPMLYHLVQLTLPMNISILTQSSLNTIVQKISLLLGDVKIKVRKLQYDSKTNAAILLFYAETIDNDSNKVRVVNGLTIEHLLKDKLRQDVSILGAVFTDVRTLICQNNCSGHGVCSADTRTCICEAFWMPSYNLFHLTAEANCDWSVLYVFVGIAVVLLMVLALFCSLSMTCRQRKKPITNLKLQKYSLIESQDKEAAKYVHTTSLTESDSDSDVLFDSRTKSYGLLYSNGVTKFQSRKHSSHRTRKIKA